MLRWIFFLIKVNRVILVYETVFLLHYKIFAALLATNCRDTSFIRWWWDKHFLEAYSDILLIFEILDYVRVMDMGLLELTITAVKSDSDGEQVSY